MLSPVVVLYLVLLGIPLALTVPLAFNKPALGQLAVQYDFSLGNFERLFSGRLYLLALGNSVVLSLVVTFIALAIGFCLAWTMARTRSAAGLNVMILTVMAAMQIDVVLRLFGLVTLLGDAGTMNRALRWAGISEVGVPLMYNRMGVAIGLTQVCTPIVVLALVGALRQIDQSLLDTARSLGAGSGTVLHRIVVPWALPQLTGAALLVFGLSVSSYVVPALLAGGRVPTLATQLYEQIMGVGNWQFGASIAVLLFIAANLMVAANMRAHQQERAR